MSKELLDSLDKEIQSMQAALKIKTSLRTTIAYHMVNHALNCAPASHRVCCGSTPIQIAHGLTLCKESPTGKCVYKPLDESYECLFCHLAQPD